MQDDLFNKPEEHLTFDFTISSLVVESKSDIHWLDKDKIMDKLRERMK